MPMVILPPFLTFASRYDNVDLIELFYKLEMRWLTRRPFRNSPKGIQRMEKRARKLLLRGGKFYRIVVLISGLFAMLFFTFLWLQSFVAFVIPIGLILVIIALVVGFGQNAGEFQMDLKKRALRNLLRDTKMLNHEAVFLELAERYDADSKLIALGGLSQIATEASLEAIKIMRTNVSKEVARIAKLSYERLKKVLDGEKPLALTSMKTMQSRLSGMTILFNSPDQAQIQEARERIESMVYSQLMQRQAFPHVFCRQCYARAEERRFRDWRWVQCKVCKEAKELLCDVRNVVGQIGGDDPWELADGTLFIGLWKNESKTMRYAELNRLEIIGGKSIDYDYAVSKWVEAYHQKASKTSPKVSIHLLENPPLSPNSLRLLQVIDPNLQTGA